MRIVLISPEYPPAERMGGIGTNTATVARALARRGEDVLVVTRGSAGRSRDEGVEVVRLERRWFPNRAVERLAAYRQIAKAARRFRPDVVQAAEWEAEAWWLARWSPIPVVTRLATPTYMLELLNFGELRPQTAFVRRLERDQARQSALVFAPTGAIADRVAADWQLPAGAVELVPNPVDVDEVVRAGTVEPPVDLPERFVAFIGRLERRKGIESLGAALGPLLAARRDLHAVLVGRDSGEEGGAVMEQFRRDTAEIAARVHVLGELPRQAALAVVARAEAVALPSLWESFGYVCVEAMALGRPVVAARVGGFAEIVEDGRSGRLVPPGDAAALEQALERFVDAPEEERRRLGEEAVRRARDFDVDAVVDRIGALLERVAGGSGGLRAGAVGYRRYFRPEDEADPFRDLYEQKKQAVLAHFAGPRRRILDVGGGYGRLAGPLSRHHDVVLCDVSREMLDEARGRWPGLELVEADARELPFADGEFDAALAIDLFPHLPKLEEGLRELVRVVRPGGDVVFDTTNASPWWVLAYPAYFDRRPKRLLLTMLAGGVLPEWRATVRHHKPHEVREAAAAVGLRIESCRKLGPPWSPKWHLWWGTAPA